MSDPLSYFFVFAGQSVLSVAAFSVAVKCYIWSYNRRRCGRRRARFDLRGKYVLITGASSGLGCALAREFYIAGARVIMAARTLGKLKELRDELRSIDLSTIYPADSTAASTKKRRATPRTRRLYEPSVSYLDLADSASIAEAVADILRNTGGRLDVLVNNAGVSMRASCEDTSMAVHRQLMEVNYFGHVELTKLLVPALSNAASAQDPAFPGPCIVCISSIQGRLSIPYRSAYGASKHAFQAYFDCLRAELESPSISTVPNVSTIPNVRVLVISAGYIATNLSLNALTGDGKAYGKMDESTAKGMRPEYAAKQILRAIRECRREVLLAPCYEKLGVTILRPLLPGWYFWWAARRARKEKPPK